MLQMPILIKFQNLIPVMEISQIAEHHFNIDDLWSSFLFVFTLPNCITYA